MKGPSESYILSEGYHDRAFWRGLLLHLGCTDPGARPNGRRVEVYDPFGLPVRGGHFAFHSRSGSFIRIVQAGGKTQVRQLLRTRLRESGIKGLAKLVINVDADEYVHGAAAVKQGLTLTELRVLVREFDRRARTNADNEIEIHGGETKIALVRWQVLDPAAAGIPHQQTLERLMCAAIIAAYPNRAAAVQAWLDSRPDAPLAGPKEYAWSYLAGWHAASGSYEGFCTAIWGDPLIPGQLTQRLEPSGAWRVANTLAA